MPKTRRHKVFISYHHGLDEEWKTRFIRMMGNQIIDKSIYVGDIVDTNFPTAVLSARSESITFLKLHLQSSCWAPALGSGSLWTGKLVLPSGIQL